ncbi:MAG: YigZ family protein [Campylobacter sp.]|nr:YigZ family protein [Campylobacter sp.]
MQSIDQIYQTQIEIKKSNFIAYLCPFSEFKNYLDTLKNEHPKATHIVWAYRMLNEYEQIVENQNDDGEPKGTSGLPSLNALRGAKLINTVVFVVRYFGGIKLGTGGLVRAYSSAVNAVINEAKLIKFELKSECVFFTPFSLLSRFEHFFQTQNLEFTRKFTENGAIWMANFNKNEFLNFNEFAKTYCQDFYDFDEISKLNNSTILAFPLFAKQVLYNY